jgi:hypothetical protein
MFPRTFSSQSFLRRSLYPPFACRWQGGKWTKRSRTAKGRLRTGRCCDRLTAGIEAEGDLADALRAEPIEGTRGQLRPALRACARVGHRRLFLLLTSKANPAEDNRKNAEPTPRGPETADAADIADTGWTTNRSQFIDRGELLAGKRSAQMDPSVRSVPSAVKLLFSEVGGTAKEFEGSTESPHRVGG